MPSGLSRSEQRFDYVPLDKKLVQEAMGHYRAWNEAVFEDEVANAGRTTPQCKWRDYCGQYEFSLPIRREPSPLAQVMEALEWQSYYETLQLFEARRQAGERSSS